MQEFNSKSNIVFGKNAIDWLSHYKGVNVTIIADPILRKIGQLDAIIDLMPECVVSVYDKIEPDPSLDNVTDCFKFVSAKKSDVIVAIGGGSAIDTSKAVILVCLGSGMKKPEFVAIPTTSGTGTEVTNYSVIRDNEAGRKIPMSDDSMIPDVAILDYNLTKTMPASVTAFTGMDAITHALEAYVATGANVLSDAYAEKALELAFNSLPIAFKDGENEEARENMMMASNLAGMAFNSSGLGLCHSIAHSLGAAFHIPHGEANAIVLPHVIAFNSGLDVAFGTDKSVTAKRYADIAKKLGLPAAGVRLSVQYLVKEIDSLNSKLNIPKSLMQLGVNMQEYKEKRSSVISSVLADMCLGKNPKKPDQIDVGKILDKVFHG